MRVSNEWKQTNKYNRWSQLNIYSAVKILNHTTIFFFFSFVIKKHYLIYKWYLVWRVLVSHFFVLFLNKNKKKLFKFNRFFFQCFSSISFSFFSGWKKSKKLNSISISSPTHTHATPTYLAQRTNTTPCLKIENRKSFQYISLSPLSVCVFYSLRN